MSPPTWRDRRCSRSPPLDRLTGGRVEIGVGSGWHERSTSRSACRSDPRRSGSIDSRRQQRCSRLVDDRRVLLRRSVRIRRRRPQVPTAQVPHPPIAIGGAGHRRTPALAARFADEFNAFNGTVDATAAAYARVEQACLAQQQDPASLLYSQNMVTVLGEDEHQFRERMEQLRRQHADPRPLDEFIAVHRGIWLLGTAEDARRALHARAEIGVQRRAAGRDRLRRDGQPGRRRAADLLR